MQRVAWVESRPEEQRQNEDPAGPYVPLFTVVARAGDVDAALRETADSLEALLAERRGARARSCWATTRRFCELEVDEGAGRVTVWGRESRLTRMELRLLVAFVKQPDRVRTRGDLLQAVWGLSALNHTRTVDVHVQRLRDKLGTAGRYIQTVRGAGYRFSVTMAGRDARRRLLSKSASDPEARPSVGR